MKPIWDSEKPGFLLANRRMGSKHPSGWPWITCLILLISSLGLHAADSERFLDRLSSETRDDKLIITVHFMQTLQYLSRTG